MADVLTELEQLMQEAKNDPEINRGRWDQSSELKDGTYYGKLDAIKFVDKNKKGNPMVTFEMSADIEGTQRSIRKWFVLGGKNAAMQVNMFRRNMVDLGMSDEYGFAELLQNGADIEGMDIQLVVKTSSGGYQNIYVNKSDEINISDDADANPFGNDTSTEKDADEDPFGAF